MGCHLNHSQWVSDLSPETEAVSKTNQKGQPMALGLQLCHYPVCRIQEPHQSPGELCSDTRNTAGTGKQEMYLGSDPGSTQPVERTMVNKAMAMQGHWSLWPPSVTPVLISFILTYLL